jgi:hypothetical protein
MWKKNFSINHPIFKKRGMRTQNNSESLIHINVRRKPRSTVKNYQWLGYISYDATTSTWVTFSYELTGTDVRYPQADGEDVYFGRSLKRELGKSVA